jgi:hypothetical protein
MTKFKEMNEIQRGLFSDPDEEDGEELKQEGIDQVLRHAPAPWKVAALKIVESVAKRHPYFSADDVHHLAGWLGLSPPHHPNAWGALMQSALRLGYMEKTKTRIKSKRRNQHGTEIPVYRSNFHTYLPEEHADG